MSDLHQNIALAKAVHTVLSNSVNVQALLGDTPRLYDNPPKDPLYPYLTYGSLRTRDISGDAAPLNTHTMSLHLWSRYGGRAEVMALMSAVCGALKKDQITLSSGLLVHTNIILTDSFRAADGRTLHGIVRLNLTTQPNEGS